MRFTLFQHRRTKKQDKKIYKQDEEKNKKDKETKKKNPTLNGKCLKKSYHFFWTPSLSAGPRCQKVNMAGRRRQLPTDGKLIEQRNI